jgi:fermentation-respiration switch protein FrsA (DUF1100 family)
MNVNSRYWFRSIAGAAAFLCLLGLGGVIASGYVLSAPVQRSVGPPPPDLKAEIATFRSPSGSMLHGWVVPGTRGSGVVVLMHAVRADRRSEVGRIRLLHEAGYSILAFDFQAHGESEGRHITFGHLESLDAGAAVQFAKARFGGERVAVIGQSLGGAAAVLAEKPLPVDAMVLESVYPDIEDALRDRLEHYLGPPGGLLVPAYVALMPMIIGVRASDLRPIDHIGSVASPVLIMSGTKDSRTKISEAEALFSRARQPKRFWAVEGAEHVDLLRYDRAGYERHVLPFLAKYLRPGR